MRMLVTTPQYRAPLPEVMAHPWMTKGFDGAPDPHLIQREPLRLDELDRRVIEGMTGFEFGSADDVETRLREVLASDGYRVALSDWEARKDGARNGRTTWKGQHVGTTPSSTSLGGLSTLSDSNFSDTSGSSPSKKSNKRFSGFDFYRKKLFSSSPKEEKSLSSAMAGSNGHSSHVHSVTGIGAHNEIAKEPLDPTRGYHPLISIYYLVREKMERERVYGPGHFASSELSMLPTSADIYASQNSASNGRASPGPHTAATSRPPVPDYSMPLPRLPAPVSSVASSSSRAPGPSFEIPSRTAATPRTRAGLDEPGLGDANAVMQHPTADEATSRLATPTLPSSPVPGSTIRAPSAATHRRSHSLSQNPTTRPLSEAIPIPQSAGPTQTTFARAETSTARQVQSGISPPPRESNNLPSLPPPIEDDENQVLEPPPRRTGETEKPLTHSASMSSAGGSTFAKRFSSILSKAGGGAGGPQQPQDKAINKRQSLTLPRSFSRPTTADKERELSAAIVAESPEADLSTLPASQSAPMPGAGLHKRAATVLETGANGRRTHERRVSIGGSIARSATTSTNSTRRASGQGRPSSIVGGPSPNAGGAGEWGMEAADERQEDSTKAANGMREKQLAEPVATPEFKPLYAKGLFSVATTSTKSASALSEDIKRVLDRFGIQYRQIKGGFECVHTPSIDLSSVAGPGGESIGGGGSMRRKPSMKRKGSKLGLGLTTSKEKPEQQLQPPAPLGGGGVESASSAESSFVTPPSHPQSNTVDLSDDPTTTTAKPIVDPLSPPVSPKAGKQGGAPLPKTPGAVEEEGGNAWMFGGDGMSEMVVRFEINVIKVSLS